VALLEVVVVPGVEGAVVRLSGEADLSTYEQLLAGLRAAAALDSAVVLVEAAPLRFCDCSALRALASFAAELRAAGRSCRLVSASRRMWRLLELAELSDLFDTSAAVIS
jgi:anti-anti-sigma factor